MEFVRKYGIIALLFALSAISVSAEELTREDRLALEALKSKPLNGMFGIGFINSVPQNDFYDNLGRAGPGFSVMGAYTFAPVPISLGLQADFLFYGWGEKYYKYKNDGGWIYARDTVSYQNMVIPITASVMIRPDIENFVFPYFEIFGGFTMISASADLTSSYNAKDSRSRFDAAWNYGIGAGTMIKLVDFTYLPDIHSRLLLDIKARYMRGTTTDYYMVTRINTNSSPEFKKLSSGTDMFTLQIGCVIEF